MQKQSYISEIPPPQKTRESTSTTGVQKVAEEKIGRTRLDPAVKLTNRITTLDNYRIMRKKLSQVKKRLAYRKFLDGLKCVQ